MEHMSDLAALNLEPGEVVGGYTLLSRLGAGAMGSVWRVRDDGGTVYAMKILRDSLADDSSSGGMGRAALQDPDLKPNITPRERLRREAMALKKVNHPGVCGIVDMELDDSLAFIVTELIEGRNLKDDVAVNGRYIGDDLERLARKLIEATKAVHAAGIVHRDIKPTNVMVSASGPVLVDFGIAMGEGESHVTRTGLVMGTPGFIAPEIIEGAESDAMTDWWSVASVLAFAATGAPVFGTKPMMAVLEREASGNANLTGLPAGTMAAFRSALSPDRAQRCTPDQLLHAIMLDALNPAAWAGVAPGGESGAMLPFDGGVRDGSVRDDDNPRTLWRGETPADATVPLGDGQSAAVTPLAASATTVPLCDSGGIGDSGGTGDSGVPSERTAVLPDQAAVLPDRTSVLPGQTAVLPESAPSFPPVAPTVPAGVAPATPADAAPTMVDPDIRPALQRVITQTAQAVPTEALAQHMGPNPADVRRGMYLQRGTLPLWLLAVPLAAMAASAPLCALAVAGLVIWLLLTLACNTESQLEREGRRGGQRKGSDVWIRTATLPWHIVKALLLMLPRLVLLGIVFLAGTAVVTVSLGLPVRTIYWYFTADRSVPLPLLVDMPYSSSGLTLAGCMAVGWLITAFGPQTMMLRLGAGALRGLSTGAPTLGADLSAGAAAPAVRGRRSTVLFTIWLVIAVALCVAPWMTSAPIDWTPLGTIW
ncbi:serine/threonine-protein kinase [Bifidobacterium scaligerum]|uniref:non-specific serine/threonine protein kinase n=1 Tax=Bifidobacterium scaligerum TaxID=2052656 RepID=A0A2M9HNV7_9BIFI|nr:serine/threonine-protein kinase [Bifidobacterium scaligerum]PJM78487.1 serine/threonine protein kinase [Bifidobacterium scaligerum]